MFSSLKMMLYCVQISLSLVGVFLCQKSCCSDWSWWRIKSYNLNSGLTSFYCHVDIVTLYNYIKGIKAVILGAFQTFLIGV